MACSCCAALAASRLQLAHTQPLAPSLPPPQEVVSRLPLATADEFNAAVASSKDAFAKWRTVPVPQRARVMLRLQVR